MTEVYYSRQKLQPNKLQIPQAGEHNKNVKTIKHLTFENVKTLKWGSMLTLISFSEGQRRPSLFYREGGKAGLVWGLLK